MVMEKVTAATTHERPRSQHNDSHKLLMMGEHNIIEQIVLCPLRRHVTARTPPRRQTHCPVTACVTRRQTVSSDNSNVGRHEPMRRPLGGVATYPGHSCIVVALF